MTAHSAITILQSNKIACMYLHSHEKFMITGILMLNTCCSLHCVTLVLESGLFGMFVIAILIDQFQAILGDETAVERVQGIQQRYHKNTPRMFTLLSQVCGKSHPIFWLLPCHNPPRYSFRKDTYLIDHEV